MLRSKINSKENFENNWKILNNYRKFKNIKAIHIMILPVYNIKLQYFHTVFELIL